MPSSASVQLNSTSASIEAEIALFPNSDTPPTRPPTRPPVKVQPETQCQQYLSCYWPDFDQALKIGFWDHLEQISSAMATFVQAIFVLVTFIHIKNISADTDPILTKFWRLVPVTLFNRCQLSQWHLFRQHLSISGISQFLLTLTNLFEPDFWGP